VGPQPVGAVLWLQLVGAQQVVPVQQAEEAGAERLGLEAAQQVSEVPPPLPAHSTWLPVHVAACSAPLIC